MIKSLVQSAVFSYNSITNNNGITHREVVMVREITEKEFDEVVLKASKPVLVDFYAPWCGDCKRLAPALEVIAEKNAALFDTVKIDVDKAPDTGKKYNIAALPTLSVFRSGKNGPYISEPASKAQVDEWLKGQGF